MIKSLNRTTGPSTETAELPSITIYKPVDLGNINYVWVKMKEPVSRIDLVFDLGTLDQTQPLLLSATKDLIFSGTKENSEEEIINQLDLLGAYYGCESDLHNTTITLYSTPSLVKEAFTIFFKAIMGAIFPEDKLSIFKVEKQAELSQKLTKSSYLASDKLSEEFYETPALANTLQPDQIEKLERNDLEQFHKQLMQSTLTLFSASSENLESWLKPIIEEFVPHRTITQEEKTILFKPQQTLTHRHIQLNTAVQTSVRAKMPTIGKNHEDYPALLLANMLLGGYFGSLLMQNIREDKGLTYGISTYIMARGDYGIFNLKTDIKTGNIELILKEINLELSKIKNGEFTELDFNKTKSYTLGVLAKSCDDLFSNLDKSKTVLCQKIETNYYKNLFSQVKACSKETMINAAVQHLNSEKIVCVTCGPEQYQAT